MATCWSDRREPSLSEVLRDPIVHLVLARDGLDVEEVRAELRDTAARLKERRAN